MATIPIRGLAAKGILHDPSPYQLDMDAWSAGANVRFHANKAERAPIFRSVYETLPEEPVFCVGMEPSSGYDTVVIAMTDGKVYQYASGGITNISPSGYTPATDPRAYTSTQLGDVLYLNRPNQAPQYFGPTSTTFLTLPHMDSTWTCRSLRAFGDYLIALNVTKPSTWTDPHTGGTFAGGAMPNLFKWSDLTLIGQVPGSWDPFDPTTSAGENPLEELTSPIVDGLALRGNFVVYSENQIWGVTQTGTQSIFAFQRLFWEGGMIAPNCAVEVDGVHYVFGPQDIYKHDGVSKVSIIDKRNKNFVFRNLNKLSAESFFVTYLPQYDSIIFAFVSGDSSCAFQKTDRCNLGAVYDIPNDTWSFIDLPNVSSISQANLDSILTYSSCTSANTYDVTGGSYYDQENTFVKNVVAVSGALTGQFTQSRLLAYDFMNKGSLTFPYSPECNAPAYLERTGIALDAVGSDLTTYKKVRRIFPLVSIYDNVPVTILVGGSETPSGVPTYNPPATFNPITDYKVDGIKGGRYLALRFTVTSPADFEVAGYDLDVTNNGRR